MLLTPSAAAATPPGADGITLNEHGYFQRDGRFLMPVGVNYWPASCGVAMWDRWPADEIRHDLDVVCGLGLNCVRFFLLWPDFEPALGQHRERSFERLAQLMGWFAERDLLAHPALVTGYMSGDHFWPEGKNGRNLYSDPEMLGHAERFCARATAVLSPWRRHLLGIDLGNELGCADARDAPPAAVRNWCAVMTAAIRAVDPHLLVVSGTDSGVVHRDDGWRLGEQPGVDFYSVHTYPVPAWHCVPFDGMSDPLAQDLLPLATLCARAFGPVMVQEFSTLLLHGVEPCESYLSAVIPNCLANGANGFLWWCLRDILASGNPYDRSPFEGRLGLVDGADRVKPEAHALVALLRTLRTEPEPVRSQPEIALYWPREHYRRDNPANPGNEPGATFRRMAIVYHFLRKLGYVVGIARADEPVPASVHTLFIAGVGLTASESETLKAWVEAGGRLVWSAPSWDTWSSACDALIGAQPVEIRHPKPIRIHAFGHDWRLADHPASGRTAARVTTARILAASSDGTPELFANTLGQGKVVTALPLAEETVARLAGERSERDRWIHWYESLVHEAQS